MNRASLVLAALLLSLPLACVDAPERRAGAEANSQEAGQAPEPEAPKLGPHELSPEELELLDADPKTLTPEQNRKRAYALRKRIMQNPDSPAAKSLEEARAAAVGGELTPQQIDPDKKDPGLVIDLPDHLKDQRVSKGEPATAPTPE